MRPRRTSPDHQEAVARRLAQLSAELQATRDASVAPAAGGDWWTDRTREGPEAASGLRVVPAATSVPGGPEPPGDLDDVPPLVPVPGRHAAQRRGPRLTEAVVPDTLRGRVSLGPGALTVVAVVVALGMALTAWVVARGDPDETTVSVAAPSAGGELVTLPSSAGSQAPSPGASSAAVPAGRTGSVTVDVAGKVRRPGIAVLDAGARVVDALEAAGGARPGVDLSHLNLARMLVDGEQILVGVEPAGLGPASSGDPPLPGASASGALVSLNQASAAELETLPEVGPVTAAAIIAWRETNGGFTSIEELLEVDGIGEATLGQIAPHVTI